MALSDVFYGIQDFSESVLFAPFNALRALELESWAAANTFNWILMLVGFVAMLYWMRELKGYNDTGEEDRTSTSHSFLGGEKYHKEY